MTRPPGQSRRARAHAHREAEDDGEARRDRAPRPRTVREALEPQSISTRGRSSRKAALAARSGALGRVLLQRAAWSFIVAAKGTEGDGYERLLSCLVEANAVWAGRAPVLMISVARLNFKRNDKPNRHAFHDTGQAAAHLALQAAALGLAVHQMAGFDAARAREQFSIPEGFEPVAAIAVGYPGEPEDLPADLRAKESAPRTRRPFGDFVFAHWVRPRPCTLNGRLLAEHHSTCSRRRTPLLVSIFLFHR